MNEVLETIVAWTLWSTIPLSITAMISEYYTNTERYVTRQIEKGNYSIDEPEIWVL